MVFSMWGGWFLTVCIKLLHGPFILVCFYKRVLIDIFCGAMFYNVSYREW